MAVEMRYRVRRLAVVAGRILFLAAPMALGLPMLALAQEANMPGVTPGAPAGPAVTVPATPVPDVSAPASLGTVDLPRDLSPWGMYQTADPLVKAVLIGLVIASVITWTVWLSKSVELAIARRRARKLLISLASARSLAEAAQQIAQSKGPVRRLVDAAKVELELSDRTMDLEGIKERIASRLERVEANGGRAIMRGTGVLATIGATAPFVGLFGTVWGIMNSFIGISKSQTTNLAVVAPGIAEALLATAFGLAAAIPAVVIYNLFSRRIADYRALLGDASAEVLRLVSRDLDRAAASSPSSSRRPISLSAAE
jgi:biopolymer transport protein ExbB